MIEWSGDHATEELVNIQRELCRWPRVWPLETARSLFAFRAKQRLDRVLEFSGLAAPSELGGRGRTEQLTKLAR